MTTVQPESALESPVDASIAGSKGKPLFLKRYEHPNAQYALVLVHGTAGYSAAYHDFAEQFRRHFPATVWAFDLTGHGRTPGPRGVFTFEDFLEDVRAVSEHAAERTGLPVVLHGASQGGEIAFHALARCPRVAGAVCMNILLNDELQMNRAIRIVRSEAVDRLARRLGDRIRVPLRRVIDFKAAYQEDPDLLPEKLTDPLNVWSYGFKSYHSVFNYKPGEPSAANTKPVLLACGEKDEIVDPDHVRACFERIGGPKDLFVMPGGGHQLMLFETDLYSRVVDSWIRERVLGRARSWTAPLDVEERTYFDFLDRERRSEASGEPDYHYSWLDKLLTRVHNGTIERGVRYFAQAQASAHWRFTEQLVSKIDYAAWPFLRDYLPESARTEPARMAVVGCGSGESIRGLSEVAPELRDWEIDGFDVDYRAIRAARRSFADVASVQFHVGDIRDQNVLPSDQFDVIYMHGILDHCGEHRAILANVYRALKPGGRVFYVAPDRNLYTWLAFVTVGPLFVSGLYKSIHDFRRFARPAELSRLLEDLGYRPLRRLGASRGPAIAGLEYTTKLNLFSLRRAYHKHNLAGFTLVLTKPRSWLGGGYLGEYVGAAEKPVAALINS
ncbi:alpha/beta fold hydrolase [Mycobacterium sp.]|jgi:alpha-beta hydrolase superfamily lysophospholipase/2-polyprenyl-3-methyl-5-hydroxy-6-metoxy-1,4-benzoquinol methylase|uniref:alpha/beta fold hydrolase n=1 Tax=Mycobacterium sp. TaxID=1785 RepID=UPI002C9FF206|nr:alpha/beta fold hydrolase [Mycobacterium sp.]HXB89387.1 alpha/beta fold hydrolase [Mycobacterium sp.]